jgi:hypothetical protein
MHLSMMLPGINGLNLRRNPPNHYLIPIRKRGSPALSMKTAVLRPRMTENSLENEGHRSIWWPWITEIAGEPDFLIGVAGRLAWIPNMFARVGHIARGVSDRGGQRDGPFR